ncbi:hypothetical protein [Endozoicomonas sp.]|uniref:hypothetical protein n=1 Tax=Endozoicomonas sp. TaxID=1892382 RepID=UPI0028864362|nr:hypothetical protein [Endozoicomonas sp.]
MTDYKETPIVELAAIVADHLQQYGIKVVLVGGLAVEIYSANLYLTKDIDMVNISYDPPAAMNNAMAEIGFIKHGRVYTNDTTLICVEFPPAPLAVGDELIKKTTIVKSDSGGKIPILLASDVVKDRLTAYFHWSDKPSLVQALAVMLKHAIEPGELKQFCESEGQAESFSRIVRLHQTAKERQVDCMMELESLILTDTINQL